MVKWEELEFLCVSCVCAILQTYVMLLYNVVERKGLTFYVAGGVKYFNYCWHCMWIRS